MLFFKYIIRKLSFLNYARRHLCDEPREPGAEKEENAVELAGHLEENVENLKELLCNSNDLKIHMFRFGKDKRLSGALLFIDGLVNSALITDSILRPIMSREWRKEDPDADAQDILDVLDQEVLCSGDVKAVHTLQELAEGCLSGDTALLAGGYAGGLIISTKGWEKRSVAEPQSETVVRGPREGFTENLRTNTALIRRKIRDGKLTLEQMKVGRKTKTDICLIYLKGVADPKVIKTVKYRIGGLDVDSILESGYIEEYIEDAPFSPFSTIGYTEKPDVAAARILEGRVGIVVDGTPFVLTVPMLFIESFQTAEDYYTRPLYASLMRLTRFVGFAIAAFAPAVYITLTAFHHELIPTTLLFTIANAREGTPFPVFLETAIMIFAFEILREAGIRLPRPVGQAISIVGALIMGDAAVSAGLVGAPVVITVALTAVSSFLVPAQNDAVSVIRVIMMILAGALGWYGVSLGVLALLIHLATLSSFGVPYFDGFSWTSNLQDSVVRIPLWSMVKRPVDIAHNDIKRRRFFIPPLRPYASREAQEEEGDEV